MQNSLSTYQAVISAQYSPTQHTDIARSNTITDSLVIALPIVVLCAIAGYQKYRTRVLRQRIQYLNRLWQLDSSKNLF